MEMSFFDSITSAFSDVLISQSAGTGHTNQSTAVRDRLDDRRKPAHVTP